VELTKVQEDIRQNSIDLPSSYDSTKEIRPVLKVSFETEPIPDPFLLVSKAAVNLSTTQGQTVLPACTPKEEEYDPLLENLKEYYRMQSRQGIPDCLSLPLGGTLPSASRSNTLHGVAAVAPPAMEEVRRTGKSW
jgi:hypothetical protein